MRPRKPIARGQPPKRSGRPKAVNRARKAKHHERAYGPEAHRAFIAAMPCVACGVLYRSECAHVKAGGMGLKADAKFLIPLCGPFGCHQKQHDGGWGAIGLTRAFALRIAARIERLWQDHLSRGSDDE